LASGPLADPEPAAIAIASRGSGSAPAALTEAELESRTGPDEGAERMVAFVVRLDAAMRELARQGHALGIGRAVWIDRTMRAWDGTAP
jgi:hypothetical protein